MRTKLLIVVALLCSLAPFAGQFYGDRAGGWLAIDFRAYYCAALAQREGRNPYFATSLQGCEAQTPAPYYHPPRNVTVPAPYPPYALAFFAPLTFVPFATAVILWWIALALSVAVAAVALARITQQPILVAWGGLVLSLGLTAWTAGNVIPVAIAALVVAALCAMRGRFWLAAAAIAVAAIEPQVALPAAAAAFIGYRRLRVPLLAAAGLLVAICAATAGVAQTLFYATTVVPAHALSEVSRDNQYSLSTILTVLGVPDASAALAGSLSYLVMGVVGIAVGLRLARRYEDPAIALLVPPAFSLLGGSFVHTGEIAAAVPAALVLATRAPAYRGALVAASIVLAIPWMLATSAAMFLAPIYPAAYLAYALWRRERIAALTVAAACALVILGLHGLAGAPAPHVAPHPHAYPPIDPRLAEAGWRQLVLGNTTNHPIMWLLRLPTWAGLVLLAATGIALARNVALAPAADCRLLESQA